METVSSERQRQQQQQQKRIFKETKNIYCLHNNNNSGKTCLKNQVAVQALGSDQKTCQSGNHICLSYFLHKQIKEVNNLFLIFASLSKTTLYKTKTKLE